MKRSLLLSLLGFLVVGCVGPSTNDFDGDGSADSVDCAPQNPAIHPVLSQNSAGLDVHRSVRFGSWPYCSLFDRDSTIPRLLLIDGRRPRSSFGTPRGCEECWEGWRGGEEWCWVGGCWVLVRLVRGLKGLCPADRTCLMRLRPAAWRSSRAMRFSSSYGIRLTCPSAS